MCTEKCWTTVQPDSLSRHYGQLLTVRALPWLRMAMLLESHCGQSLDVSRAGKNVILDVSTADLDPEGSNGWRLSASKVPWAASLFLKEDLGGISLCQPSLLNVSYCSSHIPGVI